MQLFFTIILLVSILSLVTGLIIYFFKSLNDIVKNFDSFQAFITVLCVFIALIMYIISVMIFSSYNPFYWPSEAVINFLVGVLIVTLIYIYILLKIKL